jgi:hypothetical protein
MPRVKVPIELFNKLLNKTPAFGKNWLYKDIVT